MTPPLAIPELVLQMLPHLELRDLISAMHVNAQWRALVPKIDSPTRIRLLGLSFRSSPTPWPISLRTRQNYVQKVEAKLTDPIPEPYRTILLEWPSSHPPPGMHWPHSVRHYASGFCFCFHEQYEDEGSCHCAENEVGLRKLKVAKPVFEWVVERGTAPVHLDHAHEIFEYGVRLQAPSHAQTVRLIQGYREAFRNPAGSAWCRCNFQVLELSRYYVDAVVDNEDLFSAGVFVMILEGPARGQVHAWQESTWYDGYEAESFWDWNYVEWDRAAYEAPSSSTTSEED
ncbi:F-box domain-containing protein [Mycena kentingensis (nom. inval.)]|nr:F-box domain-containing protein [Mycena kentingensis (nom. inval.)]